MSQYEVIVGNIGTVYVGSDRTKALEAYNTYVDTSTRPGRAEGEVSFFIDGELEFWFDIDPEPGPPTADQYRILQARKTLVSYGLEDAGVEAIDELLTSMGYELRESDG